MRRFLAITAATATVVAGLLVPTAAASADDSGNTTISGVSTSWSSVTVSVRFAYDSWDYGSVEAFVDGTSVAQTVLPTYDDGTASMRFARAATAGSAPITLKVTSCDGDPADPDAAAVCSTKVAYTGTLILSRSVPKGKANALTLLNALKVTKETHASTYKRKKFTFWVDANGNRLNTRAEVLKAESSKKVTIDSRHTVTKGRWVSRYDGKTLTVGSKLEIDHLVPLKEAWISGASSWSAKKREAYANDLGYAASLIAVSAHAKRAKGDKSPARWLPPKQSYDCTYVRNYIAVKSRWKLSVDVAEKAALTTALATCSSYAVAKPGTPNISKLVPAAKKKVKTGGASSSGGSSSGGSVYYKNCDAVRAAGKAPLYAGQPGYATSRLDRDGDGIACE